MVDYSLWEVIENGNAPPATRVVDGVKTIIAPSTTKEKAQRSYAIKKRFGGNTTTKKTQINLLKQQYENFTASSSEVLDQTFDRLQKLISQLEIHGKNIVEISSGESEGFREWNSPEYKDTAIRKKKPEALIFHKMDTQEASDRYTTQCFENGLYVPDGEIDLEKNDNFISINNAVKLCLDYEVKQGRKIVKKDLIVSLCGAMYFIQFIINPEEDEFEPGLILGRSFLRSAKAFANFGEEIITIQPNFKPFLLSND
ncbi:hypothetical protein Tco_0038566 [Tanacetum coccineum]